ncbi:hypothetical protein BGZ73_007839, partial [Actinomortierella ambigua]
MCHEIKCMIDQYVLYRENPSKPLWCPVKGCEHFDTSRKNMAKHNQVCSLCPLDLTPEEQASLHDGHVTTCLVPVTQGAMVALTRKDGFFTCPSALCKQKFVSMSSFRSHVMDDQSPCQAMDVLVRPHEDSHASQDERDGEDVCTETDGQEWWYIGDREHGRKDQKEEKGDDQGDAVQTQEDKGEEVRDNEVNGDAQIQSMDQEDPQETCTSGTTDLVHQLSELEIRELLSLTEPTLEVPAATADGLAGAAVETAPAAATATTATTTIATVDTVSLGLADTSAAEMNLSQVVTAMLQAIGTVAPSALTVVQNGECGSGQTEEAIKKRGQKGKDGSEPTTTRGRSKTKKKGGHEKPLPSDCLIEQDMNDVTTRAGCGDGGEAGQGCVGQQTDTPNVGGIGDDKHPAASLLCPDCWLGQSSLKALRFHQLQYHVQRNQVQDHKDQTFWIYRSHKNGTLHCPIPGCEQEYAALDSMKWHMGAGTHGEELGRFQTSLEHTPIISSNQQMPKALSTPQGTLSQPKLDNMNHTDLRMALSNGTTIVLERDKDHHILCNNTVGECVMEEGAETGLQQQQQQHHHEVQPGKKRRREQDQDIATSPFVENVARGDGGGEKEVGREGDEGEDEDRRETMSNKRTWEGSAMNLANTTETRQTPEEQGQALPLPPQPPQQQPPQTPQRIQAAEEALELKKRAKFESFKTRLRSSSKPPTPTPLDAMTNGHAGLKKRNLSQDYVYFIDGLVSDDSVDSQDSLYDTGDEDNEEEGEEVEEEDFDDEEEEKRKRKSKGGRIPGSGTSSFPTLLKPSIKLRLLVPEVYKPGNEEDRGLDCQPNQQQQQSNAESRLGEKPLEGQRSSPGVMAKSTDEGEP